MSAQPAADPDLHLRKFQKELSAGTVSLALLAVLGPLARHSATAPSDPDPDSDARGDHA
jgi:hypothetical protein